jgi:biopolymer transport protein ExbD
MKVEGAKKVHYDSGPNMTPLVDVVMVILIFLMLAGSFAGTTRFIMSKAAIHQQGVGDAKAKEESIDVPTEINITQKTGGGFVASLPAAKGMEQTDSPARLTEVLSSKNRIFLSANPQNVPKPKKFQVVLKPDKRVQYQELITIYRAVNEAGVTNIAFAATK